MDDPPKRARRRFLVVHPDVVVAEDLREALLGVEDAEVVTARELSPEEVAAEPYTLAILGLPVAAVLENETTRMLDRLGARIAILGEALGDEVSGADGFLHLRQPFRTEDVHWLLRRIPL